MAGDWIKMRGNLWDDPRVARLCDLTDRSEAPVIGALYWLWATADQHTETGIMPGLTLRQIDRKTGVPGFGQALCDIGWLADHPEGVRIVGFEEHNGTSAKRRCTDAQRKANMRNVSAADADIERTDGGQKAPNLGAREEKSINTSEANASDGVPPAASPQKSPEDMAKAELWNAAVSVLEAGGCPRSQCRTFMGKLAKDYTLPTVQQAVAAAVSAQPADAREYLKAACQRLNGDRKDPVTVPSDEPEKTAAMLEAQRMTPSERAASEAARRKVMAMVRGVVQ